MSVRAGRFMACLLAFFLMLGTTADAGAPSEEPARHRWDGHLACTLSYPSAYLPLNCPGSVFSDHDDRHVLDLQPEYKTIAVAMDWDVGVIAFTDTMRISLYVGDQSYVRIGGPPPLEFRYDVPLSGAPSEDLMLRVWGGGGGGNVNVVHDVDFTVHYHVFYDEPAPDGYSAMP